jgi:DNA-binding MarR family transcriptional regulator
MNDKLISKFNGPENSPGFLLWKLTNLWQSRIRKALKSLNLTHVQFVLLANIVYVDGQGKQLTAAQLSRFTKVDKVMVSDVVKTLCSKGLIIKKKDARDSRMSYLLPTSDGQSLAQKAIQVVENTDHHFFELDRLPDYIEMTKDLVDKNSTV